MLKFKRNAKFPTAIRLEHYAVTRKGTLATMTEETPTKTSEVYPSTSREVSTKTSHIEKILSVANREEHPELP